MARSDPRFNAFDVIRVVEKNLTVADKRLVFAWFFSTIPIKEPKVDVVNILLDLVSLVPVAGSFAALFQISLATAQVAVDIAELFKFEFEEQDVELARIKFELESLRTDFNKQRQELVRCQIDLDSANEQASALRATIELQDDEIRRLVNLLNAQMPPTIDPDPLRSAIRTYFRRVDRLFNPTGDELFKERAGILQAWQAVFGEVF